jgi:hypothetical protein
MISVSKTLPFCSLVVSVLAIFYANYLIYLCWYDSFSLVTSLKFAYCVLTIICLATYLLGDALRFFYGIYFSADFGLDDDRCALVTSTKSGLLS